jgi:MATE family multidrug resistance protein
MVEPSVPGRGLRADLTALLRLAVPIVAVQLGWMAMGVVDTIVVGHVSADAMAAVALGNLLFLAISLFGMGVLMGLDPVVAQAAGARDPHAIQRGAQRGLALALGLTVFSTLALLPARPLFSALRQPAVIVPTAAAYTHIAIVGFLPFYVFVLVRVVLQATGRVASMVWAMLAANALNLVLNWVFVFGHLGMPPLGAIGSSWATTLSRWALALFMVAFAWRDVRPLVRPWLPESLRPDVLWRLLAIGLPIGIQLELELGIFNVVGLMMGRLGAVPMAGHQVVLSLSSLTFMVPLGVSIATSVLVGQAVGRSDVPGARRAALAGLACGVGFMASSAVVMLTLPGPLARVFTTDPAVVAMAASLIPVAGVFQVFDGTQVVSIGVLRGTGDTRTPLIVNIFGYWVIALPLSAWLGLHTPAGPVGLWWGLVVGLAIVAVILVTRMWRRLSGTLQRVAIDQLPLNTEASAGAPRSTPEPDPSG